MKLELKPLLEYIEEQLSELSCIWKPYSFEFAGCPNAEYEQKIKNTCNIIATSINLNELYECVNFISEVKVMLNNKLKYKTTTDFCKYTHILDLLATITLQIIAEIKTKPVEKIKEWKTENKVTHKVIIRMDTEWKMG